MQKLQKLQSLE